MYNVSNINAVKKMFYLEINEYNSLFPKRKRLNNEIAILENVVDMLDYENLSFQEIFNIYTLMDGIIDPRMNDAIYSNLFRGAYVRQFEEIITEKEKEKALNTVLRTNFFVHELLSEKKIEANKCDVSIHRDYKHMKACQFIICCINNNGFIGKEIDKTFMDVLEKCGVDPIEAAQIKERININHLRQNDKHVNYNVINVLSDPIENIEISDVDVELYEEKDANIVSSLLSTLKTSGFTESVEILDQILGGAMPLSEFDYITNTIINNIINDMLDYKGDLANSEMYTDSEMKAYIVMEYNNLKSLLRSMKFYSQLKREYLVELAKKEEEAVKVEAEAKPEPVNKLIFIDHGTGSSLEKDMKALPEELYASVEELLTTLEFGMFTKDNTTVFKGTNKRLQYFRELRGDQVRIIYRKLNENYYEVLGVFQKEDDNDLRNYYNIAGRFVNCDVTPELIESSDQVRARIREAVENNKRIGNRYNN